MSHSHHWVGQMITCIIVMIHLLSTTVCSPAYRNVLTTQGTVRGYYAARPPHYAFLGLPYARPPTRHYRLKAPRPPEPWTGIFEAIHQIKCPQPDGTGEENCLTLNVFAPVAAASLPVIVHFHEGGFQKGWGGVNGPERLLDQGFVIVTFNYRLGVLGFLCLGLEEVPGNAGLKDQITALYWVHKNIGKFGGNSSDVTAYGTGSGAASIELLLLSGLTKGLVHKAILESGSALSPASLTHDPQSDALEVARFSGYAGNNDPKNIGEFYTGLSIKKIVNTTKNLLPCVEKEYYSTHSLLITDPRDILTKGSYHHVPMMVLYSNAKQISIISENIDQFKTIRDNFDNLLPTNLDYNSDEVRAKIAKLVKDCYFNELDLPENIVKSYVDYVNDIFLFYPIIKSAVFHARRSTVFLMNFLYKGKLSKSFNVSIHGAAFGDIFKYISSSKNFDDQDEVTVETLVTLLTNFIKLGDPTPITTEFISEIWEPVPCSAHVVDGKVILHKVPCLKFSRFMTNELLLGDQLVFWDQIYEKFYINFEEQQC